MPGIVFIALAAGAALSVGAQPPAGGPPPGMAPPASFITAAQGLGACLKAGVGAAPASATPEAVAEQAVAGCVQQRTVLETEFEQWVASPSFPAEARDLARQQFRTEIGRINAEVAEGVRKARAAAAAPKGWLSRSARLSRPR